jgi:hypothetical protein
LQAPTPYDGDMRRKTQMEKKRKASWAQLDLGLLQKISNLNKIKNNSNLLKLLSSS